MAIRSCNLFQHDGAPAHRAKLVSECLATQNIDILGKWPGNSPDLNPIEHLWAVLKKKINEMNPTSYEDLKKNILLAWTQEVTPSLCKSLAESMPRRIAAVFAAKGGLTKY